MSTPDGVRQYLNRLRAAGVRVEYAPPTRYDRTLLPHSGHRGRAATYVDALRLLRNGPDGFAVILPVPAGLKPVYMASQIHTYAERMDMAVRTHTEGNELRVQRKKILLPLEAQ